MRIVVAAAVISWMAGTAAAQTPSGETPPPPLELGEGIKWLGIEWIGINADNAKKLLITIVFVVGISLVGWLLSKVVTTVLGDYKQKRIAFWLRQTVKVLAALTMLIGVLSIWFDDPQRLATAFGLVAAGLAFALQKVVTSIAGYFVILRGNIFKVGDRIAMGGVRGDVMALEFTQTKIMEMGQPPSVNAATPEIWVSSRQYTGRIVSVPNAKIFEEPVYNYSSEFPYIWEEMTLPIAYRDDRRLAEKLLLEAVQKHQPQIHNLSEEELSELKRRYPLEVGNLEPRVFVRLTDNWLELTVRFVTSEYGVRGVKDAISRDLIDSLDDNGIGIASATYEITGLPTVRLEQKSGV